MNLGGPNESNEIKQFLERFFTDDTIIRIPFKLGPMIGKIRGPYKVTKQYEQIGGKSPILEITQKQGQMMIEILNQQQSDYNYVFYPAFRYGNPLFSDSFDKFINEYQNNIHKLLLFPQFPQYSCSTTGNALRVALDYLKPKIDNNLIQVIDRWYYHPGYIQFIANQIKDHLKSKFLEETREEVLILFTAHSNPVQFVQEGDVYAYEIGATVEMVMNQVGRNNAYRVIWQSKVGFQQWIQPSTEHALKKYAQKGWKRILIVPVGFTTENLETLYEIDIEYIQNLANNLYQQVERLPCPDYHPAFINILADIVQSNINLNQYKTQNLKLRCPDCRFEICNHLSKF